jgi:predicted permease
MSDFFVKVIPVILLFLTGWLTRVLKVFSTRDGDLFLKLALNITLPALIISTAQDMVLDRKLIYLPFIAFIVIVLISLVAIVTGKQLKMKREDTGAFLCGAMIMNTGFCLPFIDAVYGREGVLTANLFDIGNTFMIYTYIYMFAIKYGEGNSSGIDWKKFLRLPPLWGLVIGFGLKLLRVTIPALPMQYLELAGAPTTPLIMLALGIYFHPRAKRIPKALLAVVIRMGLGFLLGYACVELFNVSGIARPIILVCSSAPVGFNTIVFANLEGLDKEFASTMVSISLLLGLVLLPLMLYILQ